MKKIALTFPVSISPCGDIDVTYEVTIAEYKKLKKVIDESEEDFYDSESLQKLYNKIADVAYDEMAEGMCDDEYFIEQNLDGTYDFDDAREYIVDNFDITVQFPELGEE